MIHDFISIPLSELVKAASLATTSFRWTTIADKWCS